MNQRYGRPKSRAVFSEHNRKFCPPGGGDKADTGKTPSPSLRMNAVALVSNDFPNLVTGLIVQYFNNDCWTAAVQNLPHPTEDGGFVAFYIQLY